MGSWYWIGVAAGIGCACGVLLIGALVGIRLAFVAAVVLAAAAGIGVGLALGDWDEAVGGLAGGVLGTVGGAQVFAGTLRRGATRAGGAVFALAAAVVLTALAWIPALGYVEAALVPALAARLRARAPERFAGLRTLARD